MYELKESSSINIAIYCFSVQGCNYQKIIWWDLKWHFVGVQPPWTLSFVKNTWYVWSGVKKGGITGGEWLILETLHIWHILSNFQCSEYLMIYKFFMWICGSKVIFYFNKIPAIEDAHEIFWLWCLTVMRKKSQKDFRLTNVF